MAKYLDQTGLAHFWDNIKSRIGTASQEQVDAWLDEHPEATTTVQDNSLTTAKYQDGSVTTAKIANGAVTDAKLAQAGGVLGRVDGITTDLEMPIVPHYESGGIDSAGNFITLNTRIRCMPILVSHSDRVTTDGTFEIFVHLYSSLPPSSTSHYGATEDWQTGTVDLTQYAGKYAVIAIRKVGETSSNISSDVPTVPSHVSYLRAGQLRVEHDALRDSYGLQPITADLFEYAAINTTSGAITWYGGPQGFGNIITKPILTASYKVVPVESDVMFRIVYYDVDGTYLSASGWYAKQTTTYATATSGVLVGDKPYRVMVASTTQSQGKSIAYLLAGVEFVGMGPDLVQVPFTSYKISPMVYRNHDKYASLVKPHDHYVSVANGVTAFVSPDGADTNDGLTVLTPKQTLTAAFAMSDIQTIVCLEGTYVAGTHYVAGAELTIPINLIGVGDVTFDNGSGLPLNFYRSIYCENIHFKGGNNALVVKLGAYDRIATFYKCVFSESTAGNGLAIQGGLAYVIDCVAYGNAYDGFNYHSYNSVVNHALEVDCVSYGNGTVDLSTEDGQSSNATTTHDASYIVRVNGSYYACHGGIVADKDSFSANYGCAAGVSTITDTANYPDRASNYWSSGADMYLYGCVSYGSKYDTATIRDGSIQSDTAYASEYSAA